PASQQQTWVIFHCWLTLPEARLRDSTREVPTAVRWRPLRLLRMCMNDGLPGTVVMIHNWLVSNGATSSQALAVAVAPSAVELPSRHSPAVVLFSSTPPPVETMNMFHCRPKLTFWATT